MSKDTKTWLMKLADAVEKWPTMPKTDPGIAMVTETPAGAVKYIVDTAIPPAERSGIISALDGRTISADFTTEANNIRQVAGSLPDD